MKNETNVTFGPNFKYGFWVGRDLIKTIHIDDILKHKKKGLAVPGVGTYEPLKTFGAMGESKTFSP